MVEIHENTASRDNVKIAVLSALNIAGELFELRSKRENGTQETSMLENRIASINQKIDAALKRS